MFACSFNLCKVIQISTFIFQIFYHFINVRLTGLFHYNTLRVVICMYVFADLITLGRLCSLTCFVVQSRSGKLHTGIKKFLRTLLTQLNVLKVFLSVCFKYNLGITLHFLDILFSYWKANVKIIKFTVTQGICLLFDGNGLRYYADFNYLMRY